MRLLLVDRGAQGLAPLVDARQTGVELLYFDPATDSLADVAAAVTALALGQGADTTVTDIALVQHHDLSQAFRVVQSQEPVTALDEAADEMGAYPSWVPVRDFVRALAEGVGLRRFDFLHCALYRHVNTAGAFAWLEAETGVDLRASANMTGNVEEGRDSDWIMESDNVDIREAYFTAALANFAGVLSVTKPALMSGSMTATEQQVGTLATWKATNTNGTNPEYSLRGLTGDGLGIIIFSSSGEINFGSYTPAGSYTFDVVASWLYSQTSFTTTTLTVTASAPPGTTTASSTTVVEGLSYSATLSALRATSFTTTHASFEVVNSMLQSKAGVVFDYDGTRTYSVPVTATNSGGSTATTLTISVTNAAPTAPTLSPLTVTAGQAYTGTVGGAVDPGGSGTVTLSLSGADAAGFTLNSRTLSAPSSVFTANPAKASYTVTVTATDASGAPTSASFTILVPPGTTTASPSTTVVEGLSYTATLSASGATSFTTSHTDFEVVNSTTLQSKAGRVFDFDGTRTYSVPVTATGGGGSTATTLTISVTNAAPTAPTLSPLTVTAGQAYTGTVGGAVDPGGSGAVTLSLSGADASGFTVNSRTISAPSSVFTANAAKTSYSVTVTATDASGASTSASFTILVPPGTTTATPSTVVEGLSYSATLSASGATSFTTSHADFEVVSSTTLRSKAGVVFDFDGTRTYSVPVTATGGGGSTATTLTISVTNAAPGAPTRTGGSVTVADGATWSGATFTASDPNGGVVTFVLAGTDASSFTLNSSTGSLTSNRTFSHATQASYSVSVGAMDASGATSVPPTAFTLLVDAPLGPSAVTPSTYTVLEGGTYAATLSATGASSFTLSAGGDAELFDLSGTLLRSKPGVAFEFDPSGGASARRSYSVTVSASSAFGTTDTTLAITVANAAPSPPLLTPAAPFLVSGGALAPVALRSTDPGPAGGAVTFTLAGADAALFDVSGAWLVSKPASRFVGAQKSSYTFTVRALDASGADASTAVTVTVLTPREALEGALSGARPLPSASLRVATAGFMEEAPDSGLGYVATRALIREATQVATATSTRKDLREVMAAVLGGTVVRAADMSGFLATMTAVDASAGLALLDAATPVTIVVPLPGGSSGSSSDLVAALPQDGSGAAIFVDALDGETVLFTAGADSLKATYSASRGAWFNNAPPYRSYRPGDTLTIGSAQYRLVASGSALLFGLAKRCAGDFLEEFLPYTGGHVEVEGARMLFEDLSGGEPVTLALTSAPDGQSLRLNGTPFLDFDASGQGTLHSGYLSADCLLVPAAYSGVFLTLSDARLKTNVQRLGAEEGAAIVAGLRPVSYTWREGSGVQALRPGMAEVGFLAQQVREVLPEAVAPERQEGGHLRVGYERVVPPLLGAVQALAGEVAALRGSLRLAAADVAEVEAATAEALTAVEAASE